MHLTGLTGSRSLFGSFLTAIVGLAPTSGCVSTSADSYVSGAHSYTYCSGTLALDWGKCDSRDSTVTCCLKNYPGQYDRCTAKPPTQPQPTKRPPPLLRPPEDEEEQEESKDKRRDRCLPYYVRCIEKIGLKPGSLYGTSQCQDCFDYCVQHGFWPSRRNKKKCPGAEP